MQNFTKVLISAFIISLTCFQLKVSAQSITIIDANNSYSSSVPPQENISYGVVPVGNLNITGCQVIWTPTNAQGWPNGQDLPAPAPTSYGFKWLNVNSNAILKATLTNCSNTSSNGKSYTYNVPIRYLGNVGNIIINNNSSPASINCGNQSVTFNVGAAQNATNYNWDYSNLQSNGWSYVSGQGTTTLILNSSYNTGGNVNVTATRSGASNVSSSKSSSVSRPTLINETIAGNDRICSGTSSSYYVSLPNAVINYAWSSTGPISLSPHPNGSPAYINANATGYGLATLTLTKSNSCGTESMSKNIWVGNPPQPSVSIVGVAPYGAVDANVSFNSSVSQGVTSYQWFRDGSQVYTGSTQYQQSLPGGNCGQQHYYQVKVINNCGASTLSANSYYSYSCSSRRVSPNPAKDVLEVTLDTDSENAENLPDKIDLFSEKSTSPVVSVDVQNENKNGKIQNENIVKIDVSNLPRGTYYLKMSNSKVKNNQVETVRILLE